MTAPTPAQAAAQISARHRAEKQRVREIENENRRLRKLLAASMRRTARRDEKLRAAREETQRVRLSLACLVGISADVIDEKAQLRRLVDALLRQRHGQREAVEALATSTRWVRAIVTETGKLKAETSNPRDLGPEGFDLIGKPEFRIQRLYKAELYEWRDEVIEP